MCFPLYDCLFCISLDVATKIIGIVYMVVTLLTTILFSVPIALAWEELPLARAYFYTGMAASSIALLVSAFLLVVAAFTNKPFLMQPWIVTSLCVSAPLLVLSVAGMVTLPMRFVSPDMAAEESTVISVYFVHALLLFYFCSVVNSRKRELERQVDVKSIERLVYPTIHNQYRDHV